MQITSGLAPSQLELTTRGSELQLKLPSTRTPPSVTLRHGLTSNPAFSAWHEQAMLENAAARKPVTLTVSTNTGAPIARYQLANAWPSKLEISAESGSGGLGIETITIVGENIHRSQ
jgi:phage tail-like protein